MARQTINTGSALADRSGDDGRTAFTKTNENFVELYTKHDRTAAEISAGVTPTNYGYEPGDVRRYGQSSSASAATNKTALSNAIAANDDIDVWPGTYDNLTISSSNKRITFRPGVTIKLPNNTVTAGATSGPAVLGISGSNVTLVGAFTVDGNRANNDASSFPTSEIIGSLHVSGDNCRIEGEVFVTGAYHRGFVVQNGSSAGNEVTRLYIQKLRVYDPVLFAAMFWGVEDWQVDEIEVDIGTATASNGRVRIGSQSSSTVEARRGHIGTIRTNGAVITESNSVDVHIDSVQCSGGKFEDSVRVSVSLWTVDGSLMPSAGEAGVSFAMITCQDCHAGAIIVDGHYQTAGIAVGFTQGNVGCSADYISVTGTTSAVDDLTIGLNTDLFIGATNLRGTATGGDGLFFDYDADSDNIFIGAVHSTGHSNTNMFDVRLESNLGTKTPLVIGYINEGATRSIGTVHRTDSFSWTSGTASQEVTNPHCNATSKVILIPRDADAGVLMNSIGYYVTPGAGSFEVFTGSGGNTAAQTEWDYIIYNGL